MKNIDSFTHTRGESICLDDFEILLGTLCGSCFDSTIAQVIITRLDTIESEKVNAVVRISKANGMKGESSK